jgi:hypothetical protein
MFLFEFNNLDLEDKRGYIFSLPPKEDKGRLIVFRHDGDLRYSLWDCDTFLAEMCAEKGKAIKIEEIELTDDRINLYLDWLEEHKDDPKYQLLY